MGCNRWSGPGQRVIPFSGGWYDWDLEETKHMEWLEEVVDEIKTRNEIKQAQIKRGEEAKALMGAGNQAYFEQ